MDYGRPFSCPLPLNHPHVGFEMFVVGGVNPTGDDRGGGAVLEQLPCMLSYQLVVALWQNDEVRLTHVFVADGYFARHDVGQCIDKDRRRGEELLTVADSFFEGSVALDGSVLAEEHHCPVVAWHEPLVTLLLEQQFRGQKPHLTERVHLEEFGVVVHKGAIALCQQGVPC